MINNWRNYVIIALIILCALLAYHLNGAKNKLSDCEINQAQYLQASQDAKQKLSEETSRQRLKEQEAAKSAKQSRAHTDNIMRANVPKDCRKAMDWMISAENQK